MNKMLKNGFLMLAAGAFAVSCADYNETNNFSAPADPTDPDALAAQQAH